MEKFETLTLNGKTYFYEAKTFTVSQINLKERNHYFVKMEGHGTDIIIPTHITDDKNRLVFESLRDTELYNIELPRVISLQKVVGFPQNEKIEIPNIDFNVQSNFSQIADLLNIIKGISFQIMEESKSKDDDYTESMASQINTITEIIEEKCISNEKHCEKIQSEIIRCERSIFPEHNIMMRYSEKAQIEAALS